MFKLIILCIFLLSGCSSFGATVNDNQGDDGRFVWNLVQEPASSVLFISTDNIAGICGPYPILACATRTKKVCIIYTSKPWVEEDFNIIRHELRHCAGWRH